MTTRSVTVTLPTPDFSTVWGLDFTFEQELELAKIFVTCLDLEMNWDLDLPEDEGRHDVKLELVQGSTRECVLYWDADRTQPVCDAESLREAADKVVPTGDHRDAHPDLAEAVRDMVIEDVVASTEGAVMPTLRDLLRTHLCDYLEEHKPDAFATQNLDAPASELGEVVEFYLDECREITVRARIFAVAGHAVLIVDGLAGYGAEDLGPAANELVQDQLEKEFSSWELGRPCELDEAESKVEWSGDYVSRPSTYHARYE